MPFDPVGYVETKIVDADGLKPDLSKPSLEGLAYILRQPARGDER